MTKAERRTITLARPHGLSTRHATGRLIRFIGFDGLEFVLHKIDASLEPHRLVGKWRVTEATTGRYIGGSYTHPNEALHEVKAILTKNGKGKTLEILAKFQVLNPAGRNLPNPPPDNASDVQQGK